MKIYVGNLDYTITDDELKELFAEYGAVTSAQVIIDRMSGRSRGFGFIEMPDDEEAKKAIEELNNGEWVNKKIIVNEARPKSDGERKSGGGGFKNKSFGNKGNFGKNNNRRRDY